MFIFLALQPILLLEALFRVAQWQKILSNPFLVSTHFHWRLPAIGHFTLTQDSFAFDVSGCALLLTTQARNSRLRNVKVRHSVTRAP